VSAVQGRTRIVAAAVAVRCNSGDGVSRHCSSVVTGDIRGEEDDEDNRSSSSEGVMCCVSGGDGGAFSVNRHGAGISSFGVSGDSFDLICVCPVDESAFPTSTSVEAPEIIRGDIDPADDWVRGRPFIGGVETAAPATTDDDGSLSAKPDVAAGVNVVIASTTAVVIDRLLILRSIQVCSIDVRTCPSR